MKGPSAPRLSSIRSSTLRASRPGGGVGVRHAAQPPDRRPNRNPGLFIADISKADGDDILDT